ncbi:MAG: LLM class flavin-dependent oxidoreductase [Myxococcota bacterium]
MDIGLLMLGYPGRAREIARRTEDAGFSHLALGDTQNLGPETWGQLMLVAAESERIRVGPGVTNTTTRDVAVTASAALALQLESGGRAFCGIGRGDSALAKIGREPAPPAEFERDLARLRAYLAGESTPRGAAQSRIEWSRGLDLPRVPIEVAVSGPRVLEITARQADAFLFCLGADPKTLERARALARGGTSVFARFAGWSAGATALGDPALAREGVAVARSYEMDRHAEAAGRGAHALDDAHLDRFAIVGGLDAAVERFRALAAIGLDFVTIAPGSSDMDWETGWRSIERIGRELIPWIG